MHRRGLRRGVAGLERDVLRREGDGMARQRDIARDPRSGDHRKTHRHQRERAPARGARVTQSGVAERNEHERAGGILRQKQQPARRAERREPCMRHLPLGRGVGAVPDPKGCEREHHEQRRAVDGHRLLPD